MERGVIVSTRGLFDIDRALSEVSPPKKTERREPARDESRIFSSPEMEELERSNIVRALQVSDFRVSGERGAARLLHMNPSTLTSRMRVLGIRRPRPR